MVVLMQYPYVVFYDENNQLVYYLTMQGYKPHHDVLIKQNLYHFLDIDPKFNHKPYIIDTTTIYKMDYDEFVNLLQAYFKIIDQYDIYINVNLFLNTHINNNNINTPRHIINYAINDWLDENQINIKHPNFIDLNQYLNKWYPPKSKTEYEP